MLEKNVDSANKDESKTVYVAQNGNSKVYWYDKSKMPSTTNQKKVVSMTESEAKDKGKKHAPSEK